MEFTGYKRNMRRFAARWHLPGLYEEAGTWERPSYRRIYLVDNDYPASADGKSGREPGLMAATWRVDPIVTTVRKLGMASRSPLAMTPDREGLYSYHEDFRSLSFYRDCHAAKNMTLDRELGLLRPSRYAGTASVLYVFDLPRDGQRPKELRLVLDAVLYNRHPSVPADSALTVEVSADGERFTALGEITQADVTDIVVKPFFDEIPFYDGLARTGRKEFVLDPAAAAGDTLSLRVGYRPGVVEGYMNLAGLRLDAPAPWPTPSSAPCP